MSFDAALLAGYALATSTSARPGAASVTRKGGRGVRSCLLVDATAGLLPELLPGRTAASTRTHHTDEKEHTNAR